MRNGLKGLALVASMLVGTSALAEERIELKVGEHHVLTVTGMNKVALGDINTAEVKTLGGGKLDIEGKEAGTTKLLVWSAGGKRQEFTVVVTQEGAKAAGETK
ncbi:pilus assembly protein N-terminal domain-containing protein [Myxococcus landrumensis]|uniref:Pilus assembly protein N-terminal domain-containing protein n=1 Tax=Myxococcus landrumensis TaxID=2813577 RepID=A0ABX7N6A9_9BACT|nr:pilus assembly protein N-terminal domain-containing protein [Myxococcus landrumus]QSQ11888.1 pilus assembly protein N-terminal domain-containing protein [Myxococcus landrumus]